MTTATADERAALAASQSARDARLLALGRALADGHEPDAAALTPDELRVVHDHARRLRRLREALVARRELRPLMDAEAALREAQDKRHEALKAEIQKLTSELQTLRAPVVEAAAKTQAATIRAGEAMGLLAGDERDRVQALNHRVAVARARASTLRRQAEDAPGMLSRTVSRLAELTRNLAGYRPGFDVADQDHAWRKAQRAEQAEKARLEALSPGALRREADAVDADADEAEAELARTWAAIETAAGGPSAAAPAKRSRK